MPAAPDLSVEDGGRADQRSPVQRLPCLLQERHSDCYSYFACFSVGGRIAAPPFRSAESYHASKSIGSACALPLHPVREQVDATERVLEVARTSGHKATFLVHAKSNRFRMGRIFLSDASRKCTAPIAFVPTQDHATDAIY